MSKPRVFVAGHRGLVGSAVLRQLTVRGIADPLVRTHAELNLEDAPAVARFFESERPDHVVLAAAQVGGIAANAARPWDFLYRNLAIQNSVLQAALEFDVTRVVFLGSSCVYPRLAPQPVREEALLSGPLEETNEAYAIAKIAGLKLVEAANRQHGRRWVSVMPTNLYGPGDNFDLEASHVIPALLRKFHDAAHECRIGRPSEVVLWGSGRPLREFLHVDDLARAVLSLLQSQETGTFNVGSGEEISIRDLAKLVASVTEYEGTLRWDPSRPDGTPRKVIDSSKIRAFGWSPTISLREGLTQTYGWFVNAHVSGTVPRGLVAVSA